MYSEISLALSTTFSLIGAGAIVVLSVLVRISGIEEKRFTNINTLSIMPVLAVVLGAVSALVGFQDQTSAVGLLRGIEGSAAWLAALGVSGLFIAVIAFYCFLVNFKKVSPVRRNFLLSVAGVLGLLYVCLLGIVHMSVDAASWRTLATPVQMFGFSMLGGSALLVMMLEKADALGNSPIKKLLIFFVALGALLGIGGQVVQIVFILDPSNISDVGIDHVRAASMQIVVGIFCLVATCAFSMMAICLEERGFHSVIAVVCAFIGVFCARLVFYAL